MRLVHLALLLATILIGCGGGAPASELRTFYGEIHLHGFAGGAHLAALFVAEPVPAAAVTGDSVLTGATLRVEHHVESGGERVGACALTPEVACPPDCGAQMLVDGGVVHIAGGGGVARVALAFVPRQRTYLPVEPLPPGTPLFLGGETLAVDGEGAAAPGFTATIAAPPPLELTAPASLRVGDGDLRVAWTPDRATRVQVSLVASTADGRWAVIDCSGEDAAGELVVPAALLERLPAAPRDLQLEVSRDVIVRAPSALKGAGVIVHASYAVKRDAHE